MADLNKTAEGAGADGHGGDIGITEQELALRKQFL